MREKKNLTNRMRRGWLVGILVCLFALGGAQNVWADETELIGVAVFTVTVNPNEAPVPFRTLKEAIATACASYVPAQGETPAVVPTVTLLDNYTVTDAELDAGNNISINGTEENPCALTIDLKGDTLNLGESCFGIYVNQYASLTVTSSEDGGAITSTSSEAAINNVGNVTINGGTITSTGWYAVFNQGGTFDVNGGTIVGSKFAIKNYQGTVTISGGSFSISSKDGYAIFNEKGTLTFAGGTVSVAGQGANGFNNDGGSLTVSGGTISVNGSDAIAINNNNTLIMKALPTFVHGEDGAFCDIALYSQSVITFDEGTYAKPQAPIVLFVIVANPYTFTSGYGKNVVDANDSTFPFADLFVLNDEVDALLTWNDGGSEVALINSVTERFQPGLSTYCSEYDLWLKNAVDGITFYTVTDVKDNTVELTALPTRSIPALTPVIVSNANESDTDVTFTIGATQDSKNSINRMFNGDLPGKSVFSGFKGTPVEINNFGFATGKTYYGFTGHDFVKIRTVSLVEAHRCWLEIDDTNGARVLSIQIGGDATGIRRPTPGPSLYGGEWYDLQGRRLSGQPTQKGVYINHGRKEVVR